MGLAMQADLVNVTHVKVSMQGACEAKRLMPCIFNSELNFQTSSNQRYLKLCFKFEGPYGLSLRIVRQLKNFFRPLTLLV